MLLVWLNVRFPTKEEVLLFETRIHGVRSKEMVSFKAQDLATCLIGNQITSVGFVLCWSGIGRFLKHSLRQLSCTRKKRRFAFQFYAFLVGAHSCMHLPSFLHHALKQVSNSSMVTLVDKATWETCGDFRGARNRPESLGRTKRFVLSHMARIIQDDSFVEDPESLIYRRK
jgi:hypothetical protein